MLKHEGINKKSKPKMLVAMGYKRKSALQSTTFSCERNEDSGNMKVQRTQRHSEL